MSEKSQLQGCGARSLPLLDDNRHALICSFQASGGPGEYAMAEVNFRVKERFYVKARGSARAEPTLLSDTTLDDYYPFCSELRIPADEPR